MDTGEGRTGALMCSRGSTFHRVNVIYSQGVYFSALVTHRYHVLQYRKIMMVQETVPKSKSQRNDTRCCRTGRSLRPTTGKRSVRERQPGAVMSVTDRYVSTRFAQAALTSVEQDRHIRASSPNPDHLVASTAIAYLHPLWAIVLARDRRQDDVDMILGSNRLIDPLARASRKEGGARDSLRACRSMNRDGRA